MTPREAVLAAACAGVEADTAEEGFAEIRALSHVVFADAELAEAVASCVKDRVLLDPVRLKPGALQCRWQLELVH